MARKRRGPDQAPARTDIYVGMLLLTVLAMAAGTTLLALECNEYDWVAEPTAGPTVTIPPVPVGPRTANPADPAVGGGNVDARPFPLTRPADLTGPAPVVPPVLAPLTPTVPVSAEPEIPSIR